MPIASMSHHPDTMPHLGVRILLSNMLFQMVEVLEQDILDDYDIREGRQAIEYELMPFYRECPRDYNQFDLQPLQWWRKLQATLIAPWVNLRFELLEQQGVWKAMVEAGSLEARDLQSVYRVAEVTENRDSLAEARLPLINTFDALMERYAYRPLTILNLDDSLDDQLADLQGYGIPVDFVLYDDEFDLLNPPKPIENPVSIIDAGDQLADDADIFENFDLVALEQEQQDPASEADPFAEQSGLAGGKAGGVTQDMESLDDLDDLDGPEDVRAIDRWEHQQELLLVLSNESVKAVAAMLDESVFQRWQVEIVHEVQGWLVQMESVMDAPIEHKENAKARLTMGFHPYVEQGMNELFYSMHVQLAALAIISNGDLEPFDEVDRQQRGERLLEVIDDAMFLRLVAYMGGPLFRMGLTEMDPTLIADGGVTRH